MARYDLICLDYDGTLVHSVPAITATMAEVFPSFGMAPPVADAVRAAVGMGIRETFFRLNPDIRENEVDEWITRYRAVYPEIEREKTRLFAGALDALRALHDAGCAMAVVSNKGRSVLKESVDRLGLEEYVFLTVGDRPGYAKKPDPRVWEEDVAPAFPGVSPQRVLMVGDGYPDMAFARAVGMVACFASWGYGDKEQCLALEPEHIIDTFGELPGIFG
ncbi:MAG: HAD family hydrolase [Oceanidesulfovibrio sp.]